MSARPAPLPTVLTIVPSRDVAREHLVRRARFLAWVGLMWHAVEAGVAVAAGVAAGSIALIGFGADSLIELAAGLVVLWLFSGSRPISERRAQQLIALSFYLLAAYVGVGAVRDLAGAAHPHTSWAGIALAGVAAATMPPLAIAKARLGRALGSSAATSESRQSWLCAYLSLALLVGLGGNAAFGWWWLDPIVGLVIVGVAVREGCASWRGQSCCTAPCCR